jgi:hypothetical protein
VEHPSGWSQLQVFQEQHSGPWRNLQFCERMDRSGQFPGNVIAFEERHCIICDHGMASEFLRADAWKLDLRCVRIRERELYHHCRFEKWSCREFVARYLVDDLCRCDWWRIFV